jgi:hypothetical protein
MWHLGHRFHGQLFIGFPTDNNHHVVTATANHKRSARGDHPCVSFVIANHCV